jgi:UDP-N-acetylmuramyl tripeptide synthase
MLYLLILVAKISHFFLKILGVGAGLTLPGYLALKLYPGLFKKIKFNYRNGVILISGTNGKTTTSKLITKILNEQDYRVLHNKSGSNIMNGIASSVLLDRDIFGRTKSNIAVLEVDEFYLPEMMEYLDPIVVVLLNLSRDQLDRYGEVDIIYERWKEGIKKLNKDRTVLVVDSTQKIFSDIKDSYSGEVHFFNDEKKYLKGTGLVGTHNAKNINAALKTVELLEIPKDISLNHLKEFDAAFGRGEAIEYKENNFKVLLAKIPASFDHNLNAVIEDLKDIKDIIFVLNDNIPDGRDVSWIYDIDTKSLKEACAQKNIYVTGKRYLDMAIRVNYAGVKILSENISFDKVHVINKVLKDTQNEEILVMPNYSAMLEIREILTGRKIL